MNNIILIGFMGCGKSTVGRELLAKTGFELIDADAYIEKTTGMKISDIFSKHGESWFREQESLAMENLSKRSGCIISCGGGVVETAKNRDILKAGGKVIYLKASLDNLWARVGRDPNRPLSKNYESFRSLFDKRKSVYEDWADVVIDTRGKSPAKIAELIIEAVK